MYEKVLDIGCGNNKAEGAIGIDINPSTNSDIVCDLENFSYPIKDNKFDIIICYDILEHLTDTVRAMKEIHRIATPNAKLKIRVPHYACWWAWIDPTHKKLFSPFSFDHFIYKNLNKHNTKENFVLISRKIGFHKIYKWIGIAALANKFPVRYEQFFAFIFRPYNIDFDLRVLKD